MNELTMYENEEYGKEYLILAIEVENLDNIPVFIRTTVEQVKISHKYVKIIITDGINTETEYLMNSVRSNKKGPAFIDRMGKKYFYDSGKEMSNSESLINEDRSQKLREILEMREFLDDVLDDTELPRSGL